MKEVYTTGEVARICEVSKRTVINWFESGKIAGFKMPSGVRRIPREALVNFLEKNNYPVDDLDLTKYKILIFAERFDDLAPISKNINQISQFDIRVATTREKLNQLLKNFVPQVVILDSSKGEDICTNIKSTIDTKVICIYNPAKGKKKTAKKQTFDELLTKPVSKEKLVLTLAKHLGIPDSKLNNME